MGLTFATSSLVYSFSSLEAMVQCTGWAWRGANIYIVHRRTCDISQPVLSIKGDATGSDKKAEPGIRSTDTSYVTTWSEHEHHRAQRHPARHPKPTVSDRVRSDLAPSALSKYVSQVQGWGLRPSSCLQRGGWCLRISQGELWGDEKKNHARLLLRKA